jgi:hypothetical protein
MGDLHLRPTNYESIHRGFDTRFINEDPNRLVPLDVLREMEEEGLILHPLCRFPLLFTPSNFLLVFSMLEVREPHRFMIDMANDPHVSVAYNISEGRYNTLLFESHADIESYLRWERSYENKYPGCFGSIKNSFRRQASGSQGLANICRNRQEMQG